MATIRKRGGSSQIRVSIGYDTKGKNKEQAMTWKPSEGLTARQIEGGRVGQSLFQGRDPKGRTQGEANLHARGGKQVPFASQSRAAEISGVLQFSRLQRFSAGRAFGLGMEGHRL
ncbi:MAG: hypothetical protein NC084_10930 [Bacteroides sp.]|nr:hypothetical protein [Bacteroides sp.]